MWYLHSSIEHSHLSAFSCPSYYTLEIKLSGINTYISAAWTYHNLVDLQHGPISTLRIYMHSSSLCPNSHILNEPDAKTENLLCLLTYDFTVIAQRCFLFHSLFNFCCWILGFRYSMAISEDALSLRLWTVSFPTCHFTEYQKASFSPLMAAGHNWYIVLYKGFVLLLKGHDMLS